MGFLIRWFWLKPKWFDLELPNISKTTKIKTVITSIPSVWVTRPTRSHFGAIRAHLGPVGRACCTFCGFEANRTEMVWYSKFRHGSQISVFRRKKSIWTSNAWLPRNLQNEHLPIFFETPCILRILWGTEFSAVGRFTTFSRSVYLTKRHNDFAV